MRLLLTFLLLLLPTTASAVITLSPSSLTFTGAPGGPRPPAQSVTVTVPGGLAWTSNDTCAWFDASPQFGTSGEARAVVLTAPWDALAAGTYTCVITYSASGQPNQTLTVTGIKQTASGPPPGVPSAPTSVRRDVAIWTLSWTWTGGNVPTSAEIRRRTPPAPMAPLVTTAPGVTVYDDRAVVKGQRYCYDMRGRTPTDATQPFTPEICTP